MSRPDDRSPAGPWWHPDATDEALAAFHDAAADLLEAAPWRHVPDASCRLFLGAVDEPDRIDVVTVHGQDGGRPGLRFFRDVAAHRAWLDATAGGATGGTVPPDAVLPRHGALEFVPGTELEDGTRREILAKGWTIASDRAWPVGLAVEPDGTARAPHDGAVGLYGSIARTVAAVLADPEPWLRAWREGSEHVAHTTIGTDDGDVDMRVSTATPAWMTLFEGSDAELLAGFEDLDWSDGLDGVDSARLAQLERTLIARMRTSAPELVPERSHAGIELLLDASAEAFGTPVTRLTADRLEDILFDRVPRQVAVPPAEATRVLDGLRGTLRWLAERHELAHGTACLALLDAGDTAERLATALAETDVFDAEKRRYMDGTAAGFDMATDEGREGYLDRWRREKIASMMSKPGGDAPYAERGEARRPAGPVRREKRKANRKAARKSRKQDR